MRVRPVAWGLAVVIVGPLLTTFVFVMLPLGFFLFAQGIEQVSVDDAMAGAARMAFSPWRLLFELLVEMFFVAAGGLVVALRVDGARVRHALIMGAVYLAFNAVFGLLVSEPDLGGVEIPQWPSVVTYIGTLPAAYYGGRLGSRFRPPDGQAPEAPTRAMTPSTS